MEHQSAPEPDEESETAPVPTPKPKPTPGSAGSDEFGKSSLHAQRTDYVGSSLHSALCGSWARGFSAAREHEQRRRARVCVGRGVGR